MQISVYFTTLHYTALQERQKNKQKTFRVTSFVQNFFKMTNACFQSSMLRKYTVTNNFAIIKCVHFFPTAIIPFMLIFIAKKEEKSDLLSQRVARMTYMPRTMNTTVYFTFRSFIQNRQHRHLSFLSNDHHRSVNLLVPVLKCHWPLLPNQWSKEALMRWLALETTSLCELGWTNTIEN